MERINEASNHIPSLVRLYQIEKPIAHADNGWLFFSGFDELFKMLPGWVYRKLVLVNGNDAIGVSDIAPSIVKSGFEVMDGIAADKREALHDLRYRRNLLNVLSSIWIDETGCLIGRELFATEGFGGICLELLDVLSGPFDL